MRINNAAVPMDIVDRHKPATVIVVEDDYCAACGRGAKTPALLYARYPSGGTLALCGHHGTEKLGELLDAGAAIIDHRDQHRR